MRLIGTVSAGIAATVAASIVSLQVWVDNMTGFRDAGAMADLIAATFAMISAIWLICAVFLQRAELGLQRAELKLQREEIARLAEASEQQNLILAGQTQAALKANLTFLLQGLVKSQWRHMEECIDETIKKVAQEFVDQDPSLGRFAERFATPKGLSLRFEEGVGRAAAAYERLYEGLKGIFQFHTVERWAQAAAENGLLAWFQEDLPFTVDLDDVNTANLYIALHAISAKLPQ
jgi:hypothetical protein